MRRIGEVRGLFRYPVKSMRGEPLETAALDWHGIEGDRRLALRRVEDRGGFPWLTATKLPELILFSPERVGGNGGLPTHVRIPEGEALELFSAELAEEVGRRHRAPVQMMHLRNGIFDEAGISVIGGATVREIAALTGHPADARRFRPNLVIDSTDLRAFAEDAWLGSTLIFGEGSDAAAIAVTQRDERCAMVNFDPDTARSAPEILKTIARQRDNKAGVYASVIRPGRLVVGQAVFLV